MSSIFGDLLLFSEAGAFSSPQDDNDVHTTGHRVVKISDTVFFTSIATG